MTINESGCLSKIQEVKPSLLFSIVVVRQSSAPVRPHLIGTEQMNLDLQYALVLSINELYP